MRPITAVAYDRESGRIIHMHHFFSVAGDPVPSPHPLEAAILHDVASQTKRDRSTIGVVLVEQHQFDRKRTYKIDVHSKALVETDHPHAGLNSAAGFSKR
jgi:hypothetical protein